MITLLIFLLKSTLVSAFLMLWYLLVLRNTKLHVFNRIYLLAVAILAAVLPLLHIRLPLGNTVQKSSVVKILNVVSQAGEPDPIQTVINNTNWSNILLLIYWVIAFIAVIIVSRSVLKLVILATTNVEMTSGLRLVSIPEGSPYSFFRWLYWNHSIDMDSAEGILILKHEKAHIQQLHSFDKLFVTLTCCLLWANPVLFWLKKELAMQHEFLADKAAVQDGDTVTFASMLLHAQSVNAASILEHSFFHSPIKRRLLMLTQKNTSYRKWRILSVFPVVLLTIGLCSFSFVKRVATTLPKGIIVVIDAGHGGTDDGGEGLHGLKEKDLNWAITKELERLAPEYGITTIATRSSDEFINLDERVKKGNSVNATAYLSIHISKDILSISKHTGFEVYVCAKNKHYDDSKLLASSVLGQLDVSKKNILEMNAKVIRYAEAPAILVECGNIDNTTDMDRLTDKDQLEDMCRKILMGIAQYQKSRK